MKKVILMGAIALLSHSFVSAQALYEPIAAISTLGYWHTL
jgi:hypothetical protein